MTLWAAIAVPVPSSYCVELLGRHQKIKNRRHASCKVLLDWNTVKRRSIEISMIESRGLSVPMVSSRCCFIYVASHIYLTCRKLSVVRLYSLVLYAIICSRLSVRTIVSTRLIVPRLNIWTPSIPRRKPVCLAVWTCCM